MDTDGHGFGGGLNHRRDAEAQRLNGRVYIRKRGDEVGISGERDRLGRCHRRLAEDSFGPTPGWSAGRRPGRARRTRSPFSGGTRYLSNLGWDDGVKN
jgi:hypothetical protein